MTMTRHPDIDDLSAFAFCALDPDAAEFIQTHLEYCPDCLAIVRDYRRVVGLLRFTAPLYNPAEHVKARLLDRVAAIAGSTATTDVSLQEHS